MSERIVELEVQGLDIFDENIVDFLQENFPSVQWSLSDDKVIASFFCEDSTLIISVQNFIRELSKSKLGSFNFRWHDDFVGYSEIALRTGLSAEGIRKWAKGERGNVEFPKSRGNVGVGQHRSPVWCWADIYTWLDKNGKYSEGVDFPTYEEICALNAAITWMKAPSYQAIDIPSPTIFEEIISSGITINYYSGNLIEGTR